jgi:soluble P-type ATPase
MPVRECQINNMPGYKWGQEGKCYTGKDAKKKAYAQGIAIGFGLAITKVSFDYDETLTTAKMMKKAKELIATGINVYIISARHRAVPMFSRADELGIPKGRIYATGSNKAKVEKILELDIDVHYDNNPDIIEALKGTNTRGVLI